MDPVTICNMALGAIGQSRIHSLDDGTVASELCSTFFEPAVRKALSEKAWLFATGSNLVSLGDPQEGDDPEMPVRFKVPGSVVTIHKCDDGYGDFSVKWERRDEYVVAEPGTAKLLALCTTYIQDPKRWTPTFCWAVAYLLASNLAGPITESHALGEKMEAKYERELHKAGVIDGMQGNVTPRMRIAPRHTLASRR